MQFFISGLQTAQLIGVNLVLPVSAQAVRLSAAHKWFTKHKPHGMGGDDPSLAAALAASLSISAAAPAGPKPAVAAEDTPKPFVPQGTKHEFFSPYTGAAVGAASVRPSLTASAASAGWFGRSEVAAGTAPGRPAQAAVTAARQRAQPDMPLILQPAVKREAGRHAAAGTPAAQTAPRPGQVSATGPVFAPKGRKARAVFDPDHLEAPPGPAPNTQGKAPSWFQGPYRPVPQGSGITPPQPKKPMTKKDEEEEVAALRAKWAHMEDAAARGVVHAEAQVAAWAEQRARLEEEIVRRQEASRYAAPAVRVQAATPPPGAAHLAAQYASQGADYISAYAGVTVDMVGALASGAEVLEHAPDALRAVPGLAPPPSTLLAAEAARGAAQIEYQREAYTIAVRTQQLGLAGIVRPEAMVAALAPVPDRSYLECVAKLPRPGSHLDSRPGSVKGNRATGTGKKKATAKK